MFLKKLAFLFVATMTTISLFSQPLPNYYTAELLDGKNGRALEIAVKDIVHYHTKLSYSSLEEHFKVTDKVPAALLTDPTKTDQIYDMYSNWAVSPLYYSGSGFNKEHSLPKSWWGGDNNDAYSDLHHLTPSESAANNAKSNYPLGEYNAETMTSTTPTWTNDWSKVWIVSTTNTNGYGGGCNRVWEPNDEYKGDFARMYLHIVCAYEGELTWSTNYMFTNESGTYKYTNIKSWALELLLKWHRQDPVSQKELDRNNAIEDEQGNRNAFIDYPELVEFIWGNRQDEQFCLANAHLSYDSEQTAPTFELVMSATVGQPFTGMTLTTDSDGAVTYTSSNTSVATVDAATGAVTIVAAGTTTITATTAETATYNQSTARYKIEVKGDRCLR